MNRKEILTRDAKRVRALIGGILFPAPWIAEKLLYLWWFTMERDVHSPEDRSHYQAWREAYGEVRATVLTVLAGLVCGVACIVTWSLVFLPRAAAENDILIGAWLAIWGACFCGYALGTAMMGKK